MMVPGPLFTSLTSIMALNFPSFTGTPCNEIFSMSGRQSGSACSGLAASVKKGPRPFRV